MMDADQSARAYRQFANQQLVQVGKIASPLAVVILCYFIISDLYFREVPAWALTRLLPLLLFLFFTIASFTNLAHQSRTVLTVSYHMALFAAVSMSYAVTTIAWNSGLRQVSVTGLVVVCIAVFLVMRGPILNLVLIYLIPSLGFAFYIIGFMDDPKGLADLANSTVIILGAIAVYAYDERLRRSKFLADAELLLANQKLNVLTNELQEQNVALQTALKEVHQLSGLLPICANCKRIRDEDNQWHDVAVYIHDHSAAEFSHGICPDCARELYPTYLRKSSA